MSAKKAKKKPSQKDRQEQRAASATRRAKSNLRALGLNVDVLGTTDAVAVRTLEKATVDLRDMHTRMRRRDVGTTTEPTPERRAHSHSAPREIDINPASSKAHKFDWVVDTLRNKLSARQYEAAKRLRERYLILQPRSSVVDTTGAGGPSDPTGRLPMTEAQERAAREFKWIMGRIPTGELKCAIENFILERPIFGDTDRPLSLAEYGTRVCGFGRDKNTAGAIRDIVHVCSFLEYLWHAYRSHLNEQCAKTDRLMRSEIGRRAARDGWICALWDYCRASGKLPETQGHVDQIRARHNNAALDRRSWGPARLDKWRQRENRLIALTVRADETGRVRMAS